MTSARGKVLLVEFLQGLDDKAAEANATDLAKLHDRLTELRSHVNTEPEIAAQTGKLIAALPKALASEPRVVRQSAVRTARTLAADLKERWIAADAPPLLDKIDDHLTEIDRNLGALTRPDADTLRTIAGQIDTLAEPGRRLDGLERRFRPWAILGSILFIAGLVLMFQPSLLAQLPAAAGVWAILICLGFLPGLATVYAWQAMPRSRADAEIDALNRAHFLPYGGLYFPADEQPAGVILVDYTAPPPPDPSHIQDPRKTKDHENSLR